MRIFLGSPLRTSTNTFFQRSFPNPETVIGYFFQFINVFTEISKSFETKVNDSFVFVKSSTAFF